MSPAREGDATGDGLWWSPPILDASAKQRALGKGGISSHSLLLCDVAITKCYGVIIALLEGLSIGRSILITLLVEKAAVMALSKSCGI